MLPRKNLKTSSRGWGMAAARESWGVLIAIAVLAAVTQRCGEDKPATPLAPTSKPSPLQLSQGDSLVWESDLGEDMGFEGHTQETKLLIIGLEFEFYGSVETEVYVDNNGNLNFGNSDSHWGGSIPLFDQPPMIAPLYTDLNPADGGAIYSNLLGEPPNRRLVITWFNMPHMDRPWERNSVQLQLYEGSNQIQFGYNGISSWGDAGVALDNNEYTVTARSEELLGLDMTNICYYPEGGTYRDERGSCIPPCPDRPWFHDPAFRGQLQDLWEESNPVLPGQDPAETTERGAWILDDGGTYRIEREGVTAVVEYGGCATDFQPPPPAGTVAMVHTHPWRTGTYEGVCGATPETKSKLYSQILSPYGDKGGDIPVANYYKATYGVRFHYVIYEEGGIIEFEPPQVTLGKYPLCLRE